MLYFIINFFPKCSISSNLWKICS